MTGGKLKNIDALDFILAGNSTVTFLNTVTGNRFTYKIKKNKSNDVFFVKVLTSPDLYTYIGSIFNKSFKHSQKSKASQEAQSVKVFQYVINRLVSKSLPDTIEIWHEGRCGRCGRQLTVPTSIETGIGPECQRLMNKTK